MHCARIFKQDWPAWSRLNDVCAPQPVIRWNVVMGSFATFSMTWPMSAIPPITTGKADMVEPGGRSNRAAACAGCLDFDLLRYGQRVVNIDAQISHRALNLRVSKQKLNRT